MNIGTYSSIIEQYVKGIPVYSNTQGRIDYGRPRCSMYAGYFRGYGRT